jgi:hypothetical protein
MLRETLATLVPEFSEIQIEADYNWRECEDEYNAALVPVVSIRIKK